MSRELESDNFGSEAAKNDAKNIKYLRRAVALGKIFFEMYHNTSTLFDAVNNRVVFSNFLSNDDDVGRRVINLCAPDGDDGVVLYSLSGEFDDLKHLVRLRDGTQIVNRLNVNRPTIFRQQSNVVNGQEEVVSDQIERLDSGLFAFDLAMYHVNLISELKVIIEKAASGDGYYAQFFTDKVRQTIQAMLIHEVGLHENLSRFEGNHLWLSCIPGLEKVGYWYLPVVEYGLNRVSLGENGLITREDVVVRQPLCNSPDFQTIDAELTRPVKVEPNVLHSFRETTAAVRQIMSGLRYSLGATEYDVYVETKVRELIEHLRSSGVQVMGRSRLLIINPTTGKHIFSVVDKTPLSMDEEGHCLFTIKETAECDGLMSLQELESLIRTVMRL